MYDIMMIMIFAMGLGGMLDRMGVLMNLIGGLVKRIHTVFHLVTQYNARILYLRCDRMYNVHGTRCNR